MRFVATDKFRHGRSDDPPVDFDPLEIKLHASSAIADPARIAVLSSAHAP